MKLHPHKKKYNLLIILIFLQACSVVTKPKNFTDKINKVETSLIHPVYIEGDSTWSIEKRMEHYGVPGVSIAVINNNEIEFTKSYGIMDKESKSPITNSTLFQAGSISKSVAAYAALKMVEQSKIDIDENINTYLKSWKVPENEFTKAKKVTLKNILNHTGGTSVHGFLGYSPGLRLPTLLEILNGTPPANSDAILVDQIPEESFRYSGGGYTIVQQMMIDIYDQEFPMLMKEFVFKPLNMTNSTFDQFLQDKELDIAATGYLPDGSTVKGKRFIYPEMAAAGLWTTAENLAKFVVDIQQTLNGNSNVVISQPTAKEMLTPFMDDGGPALGIFISKPKNETYFFHNGWVQGFSSKFVAHKDKGYGVVVLTNSNHPEFISEIIRSVALTYQWDNYVTRFQKQKLDPEEMENIVGRYKSDDENILEIYESDGQLIRKKIGEKPTELVKVSDTSYVSRENGSELIQFKMNPSTANYDMNIRYPSGYLINILSKIKENEN